jgi:hypothetical protein
MSHLVIVLGTIATVTNMSNNDLISIEFGEWQNREIGTPDPPDGFRLLSLERPGNSPGFSSYLATVDQSMTAPKENDESR